MFVALDILLRQYAVRQAFRKKKTEVEHITSAARLLILLYQSHTARCVDDGKIVKQLAKPREQNSQFLHQMRCVRDYTRSRRLRIAIFRAMAPPTQPACHGVLSTLTCHVTTNLFWRPVFRRCSNVA